jgi:hypothetical protein
MKSLNIQEMFSACMAALPQYFDGRAVLYEGGKCFVCGCGEEAADYCYVGSGGEIIVFPACTKHLKEMNGQVVEDLRLEKE